MYIIFIHWYVDRQLGYFQLMTIMNRMDMDMFKQVSL